VTSTSPVGTPVAALDTPALILDLDAFDANVATITSLLTARGVNWRPHAKAHKSPAIAHRLIAAGAIGITCAKLSEAEVYAATGIRDILIASQVVGETKARRLAELAHHCDVIVAVDSIEGAQFLQDAAASSGSQPRVVIEVNCGMNRAGVDPGEAAVELARQLVSLGNLRFAGIMAWEGHVLGIPEGKARAEAIQTAISQVVETAAAIEAAGIPVSIVSCGGTGTLTTTPGINGDTEIQAGGGVFGDAFYRNLEIPVQPALSIMVTVTSRPTPTRVLIDAGRKTVDPSNVPPVPLGVGEGAMIALSAEHGNIALEAPCDAPRVGDHLSLLVGYSDQAVHLHEQMYAVRNGIVSAVWPTLARGKLN
jgi:D-serine deaminase-like pyridoxal phosphate-dependent protein